MAALRSIGIQPDAIVCPQRPARSTPNLKRKISLMCDVDDEAVVSAPDAPSIYDIPKVLHAEGLDAYVVRRLGLPFRDVDWSEWDDLLRRVHRPAHSITIALVGKYVDLPDAYLSLAEALQAGGFANDAQVNIRWVISDACEEPEGAASELEGVDGVLVPGGFGVRGIEGKIGAIRYAREHGIPILGPVPGPAVHGHRGGPRPGRAGRRGQRRVRPGHPDPVIATMADQEDVVAGERDMGGTMRLGLYPAELQPGTPGRGTVRQHAGRGAAPAPLRGQQRLPARARGGGPGLLRALAGPPPGGVRRAAATHPFFVGTQAHPEFLSRPTRPHPLFSGLIAAALARSKGGRAGPRRPRRRGQRVNIKDDAARRGPSSPRPSCSAAGWSPCGPTRSACPATTWPNGTWWSTPAPWPCSPSTTPAGCS